jgi:Cu/Ag efflux protein CusF
VIRVLAQALALAVAVWIATPPVAAHDRPIVSGEVMAVDLHAGRITIKHGPIPGLLPGDGGTNAFQVKEPMMLNALQLGNHVRFTAERVDGQLVLSTIESPR